MSSTYTSLSRFVGLLPGQGRHPSRRGFSPFGPDGARGRQHFTHPQEGR